MTVQTGCPQGRSHFLTYTRERPLSIRWFRDAVFDNIPHYQAFNLLSHGVKKSQWLSYYKAPVLLPEQCDALYGVEPKTTDRLIRNFSEQLAQDGLFCCPETFLIHAEPVLGICWIGKPSLNYLLPPRAVLKLACWMPATQNTLRAISCIDSTARGAYEPLPDRGKMSQHHKTVEKRLASKNKSSLIQEAQNKGIYAYAKHFGRLDRGLTLERLLTHWERGGQFPPTRQELNDIAVEF